MLSKNKPAKRTQGSPDFMTQGLQLLEGIASKQGSQTLMSIGLLLSLISAWPLLETLSHWGASAWALVLLLYSLGLWAGSKPLKYDFRWASQIMQALALLSIPVNYVALSALDLNLWPNKILGLILLLILPVKAWFILPVVQNRSRDPLYILAFMGLGILSAFLPNLASPLMQLGFSHFHYSLFAQLLSGGILAWGFYHLSQQLWLLADPNSEATQDNLCEILSLGGLLLLAWGCGLSLYPLSSNSYLVSWLLLLMLLLGMGLQLRRIPFLHHTVRLPQHWKQGTLLCEFSAAVLSILMSLGYALTGFSGLAGQQFEGVHPLSCLLSSLVLWHLTAIWHSHIKAEGNYIGPVVSGSLSAFFAYAACFQMLGIHHLAHNYEAGALLFAVVAWLAMTLTHLPPTPNQKLWQIGCQVLGLMAMFCSWYQIAQFKDWSLMTTVSLLCLGLACIYWARFCQYSAIGYLSVLSILVGILSTIIQYQPLLSLDSWSWLALGLAFGMVASAWMIERLSPGGHMQQLFKPSSAGWFKRQLPDPYRFRERYISSTPYLFAEPLYNLALILVTGAWLVNLGDLSFCFCCALFYALVFAIYPSRLWLYMILLSLSDGLIHFSQWALPIRYHSWGLIMISSGWFCMGMLLEELLEARDRQNPHQEYENQKKWVKPFFHMALAANGFMLQKVFGQVQEGVSLENWQILANQALPMTVTSLLYLLKMRVYVSKLWFYPGILSLSFGLYFGLGGLLPLEGLLLLFTALAWVWLTVAIAWSKSSALQSWWQNLVSHRLELSQLSIAYRQVHLENPQAPFVIMACICAGLSLVISCLVLPAQLGQWQQAMPISFLSKSREIWLQGFQVLNFSLLALLFAFALPIQAATQRKFYDGLVLLCGSHVLLWILREQLEVNRINLVLVALAALWQAVLSLGQRHLSASWQSLLYRTSNLLTTLGILCQILWFFNLPFYTSIPSHIYVLTLAILTAVIWMKIQYRPQIWQYYVLGALLGINLIWVSVAIRESWFRKWIDHPFDAYLPLVLIPVVLLALWHRLRTRQDVPQSHGKHLQALVLIYTMLFNNLIASSHWPYESHISLFLLGSNLICFAYFCYLVASWRWLLPPATLAYACVFVLGHPSRNLLFLVLCLPLLIWSSRRLNQATEQTGLLTSDSLPEQIKAFLTFSRSSHATVLSSPIALLIPIMLQENAPSPEWSILAWQLPGVLIALATYAYHLLFLANHRPWLWWPISLLANFCWEWAWWKGILQDLPYNAVSLSWQVHISLFLPAMTCLLMGHYIIHKQAEKDQIMYLALSLFVMMPLALLATRATALPKHWLFAEMLAQALVMLLLANFWRRKALLYAGLGIGLCLLVALFGGIMLYGDAWVRWSLFLGLGLLLVITGLLLQQRLEWLRWLIGHWKHSLTEWR